MSPDKKQNIRVMSENYLLNKQIEEMENMIDEERNAFDNLANEVKILSKKYYKTCKNCPNDCLDKFLEELNKNLKQKFGKNILR